MDFAFSKKKKKEKKEKKKKKKKETLWARILVKIMSVGFINIMWVWKFRDISIYTIYENLKSHVKVWNCNKLHLKLVNT